MSDIKFTKKIIKLYKKGKKLILQENYDKGLEIINDVLAIEPYGSTRDKRLCFS